MPDRPLADPAAWKGPSLQHGAEWIHILSDEERRELVEATRALREASLAPTAVTREAFALPVLAPALRRWRETLLAGRGFVLVRGLPMDGFSDDDLARVYWLLGLQLGEPIPQNVQGELLCSVRDVGNDPNDPDTRLYTTSKRTAYEDHPEPHLRRHLLRSWLAT